MDTAGPQVYIEARLEVPRVLTDAVCNFIIDYIAGGIILEEEEDADTTGIIFYVPGDDTRDYKRLLANYFSALPNVLRECPPIRERIIKNIDWIEQYKALVGPVKITDDVVVRPTWSRLEEKVSYEIIIEPKMAFGTGSHETTRSCLKLIRENFKTGMRFLDLGTGSGILAILADKMAARYIKAVDNDPIAVENCRENFLINRVVASYDIVLGSIEKCEYDQPYDFICANIIKSTILTFLPRLCSLTLHGGKLVLSGLLDNDEREVEMTLRDNKQTNFYVLRDNQWSTFIVTRV
ncbi:MAG: 50S ribosomal protein L11 methyltransferase [candidate division Zixibacteria bacterium]|nr:50S ribosomal protein L11 methyltransferase [candidate division Zixibacteria bacterium]MDD5426853.1 50S ribosomal protein L11 methyltransferase [candidate division Zixibacteria bacterium]